jgi:hypothetical protein
MDHDRRPKNAILLGLLVAVAMATGTAAAGEPEPPGKQGSDPAAGSSLSMPPVYAFPGVIAHPKDSGCCYTFPILSVYQCPAVLAGQPGSRVVYLEPHPMAGLLGGQPHLYHY